MSVISHSFGTYLITRILAEEFDIKWDRIIFCGGVASQTFPLEQYTDRFSDPILNEIGTRDYLPALAESVTWGYGSIGSHGINSPAVVDRWHRGYTHSDFLKSEFCTKFWLPFLLSGTITPGDEPDDLPIFIRILARLPLRWMIVVLLFAVFYRLI